MDFETKMYNESLDVLEHHIKPLRRVPGVVLEQAYLNKMAEGLKPLEVLGSVSQGKESSSNKLSYILIYFLCFITNNGNMNQFRFIISPHRTRWGD